MRCDEFLRLEIPLVRFQTQGQAQARTLRFFVFAELPTSEVFAIVTANQTVGESFRPVVAGVRTVTTLRKGVTAQKLLRLFAFRPPPKLNQIRTIESASAVGAIRFHADPWDIAYSRPCEFAFIWQEIHLLIANIGIGGNGIVIALQKRESTERNLAN